MKLVFPNLVVVVVVVVGSVLPPPLMLLSRLRGFVDIYFKTADRPLPAAVTGTSSSCSSSSYFEHFQAFSSIFKRLCSGECRLNAGGSAGGEGSGLRRIVLVWCLTHVLVFLLI